MGGILLSLGRISGFLGRMLRWRRTPEDLRSLAKLDVSSFASRIVSDAVLLNDIPSPSAGESLRMDFIKERLEEFGISNVSTDEKGNTLVLFPAHGAGRECVLLVAEVGDANYSPLANAVMLSSGRARGQGLGERSFGAAALLVFAEFAQSTDFHFGGNLLVLFTISSSVDEREEAIRHFLDGWGGRVSCGILVRGSGLGVVECRHVGSYRLSVSVETREQAILSPGSSASAASILGTIASQLGGLSWDEKRTAMVNIARMEAGVGYGHWATHGDMDMEIVAEDEKMLETIKNVVMGTISKAAIGPDAKVETLVRFKRSVGDPKLNAPLVGVLRSVLGALRVKQVDGFVSDKISVLNERGIPAVAVGISTGREAAEAQEVDLAPIESGFRQLLMVVEGAARGREGGDA